MYQVSQLHLISVTFIIARMTIVIIQVLPNNFLVLNIQMIKVRSALPKWYDIPLKISGFLCVSRGEVRGR